MGGVESTPQAFASSLDLVSLARYPLASPSIVSVAVSLSLWTRVLSIYHGQTKILANGDGRFIIRISIPVND